VSFQLFSKLSWVCHGSQIFGQSVPCGRTCVRERTFREPCAQPRIMSKHGRNWAGSGEKLGGEWGRTSPPRPTKKSQGASWAPV